LHIISNLSEKSCCRT